MNQKISRKTGKSPHFMWEFKHIAIGDWFCMPVEKEDKVYLKIGEHSAVSISNECQVFSMPPDMKVAKAQKIRITYTI